MGDLMLGLNQLLKTKTWGDDKNDNKSESVEFFDLNKIEIRNLFANIKHLKQQHELLQAQYVNQNGSKGDYAKLQNYWQNFKKEIGQRPGDKGSGDGGAQYADTDSK